MGSRENYFGQSVGKILIIILSFRFSTSKNKNTDHRVKETCATVSIKVTYETDRMLLLRDSTMSDVLNLCFVCIWFNLKEKDHIRRIINSEKRGIFICEVSVIIILIYQKLWSVGSVQQKIKLHWPKAILILEEQDRYIKWKISEKWIIQYFLPFGCALAIFLPFTIG